MAKELSMTQSKAVDKGCLLDLSMPAAECASHPRAAIASPHGERIGGAVGGQTASRPLGAQVGVSLPISDDQSDLA